MLPKSTVTCKGCMCVCLCVCVCVVRVCGIYKRPHIHTYKHIYNYIYKYTCVQIRISMSCDRLQPRGPSRRFSEICCKLGGFLDFTVDGLLVSTYMYAYIFETYVYVYICIYMYIYIHIYIYIFIYI